MEPRELWERHTVLARAFCHSDEEVKTAQTTLDDAQASRARSLAAFAVVVGNDKAVAEMLGLPEREVRIARRTVGREDARVLADDLLVPQPVRQQPPVAHAPHPTLQEEPETRPHAQEHAPAPPPPDHPQIYEPPLVQEHMGWTAVQDAVLIDGWQSGVDMELLAIELGTDLPRLTARAQYLSAHGRLFVAGDDGSGMRHGGKHRRDGGAGAQHPSTVSGLGGVPVQQSQGQPHQQGHPQQPPSEMLLPDGLVPDGHGGYWANWNEMLPAAHG
jgi:hypothetical protein